MSNPVVAQFPDGSIRSLGFVQVSKSVLSFLPEVPLTLTLSPEGEGTFTPFMGGIKGG